MVYRTRRKLFRVFKWRLTVTMLGEGGSFLPSFGIKVTYLANIFKVMESVKMRRP